MSFPKHDRDRDHPPPASQPALPSSSRVLAFAATAATGVRAEKLRAVEARDPASARMLERIMDRMLEEL